MHKKTVNSIMDAADEVGLELEVYEDYSGRGMFGSRTCGVVGNFQNLVVAIAIAAKDLDDTSHEKFVEDLQDIRTDNLGRELIFY